MNDDLPSENPRDGDRRAGNRAFDHAGREMKTVIYTTDGARHEFSHESDCYAQNGVLQVVDHGSYPAKVTNFSLVNVIKWGVE